MIQKEFCQPTMQAGLADFFFFFFYLAWRECCEKDETYYCGAHKIDFLAIFIPVAHLIIEPK